MAHPGAELFGSDRVFLDSVDQLQQRGWRVVVTIPSSGPLQEELISRGVEVLTRPTAVLRKSALGPLGALRLVADIGRGIGPGIKVLRAVQPQVVYVSTITIPLWALLARLLRVPVIWHIHEAETGASKIIQKILAAPLLLATRIIANSDFTKAAMVACHRRLNDRFHVVLNPVTGPVSPVWPRPELKGRINVLFVGRLSPRKGPDVALRAVKIVRDSGIDSSITFAGSVFAGYEWFEADLMSQVQSLGLSEVTDFLGFVDDVWPVLASADVVVMPSVADEGFGNSAVEALLAGRPVIVSDAGGLIEAVDGYETARVVARGEHEALAGSICEMVQDWDRVVASAPNDAQRAQQRHSVATFGAELDKVVQEVANS
ncbi:MAG: glycosyltransferase family 4 protein [Microthrixaceae bacterium]|nr:glycosyltransferase family 4 protein [Microthrixaceae bacterium]